MEALKKKIERFLCSGDDGFGEGGGDWDENGDGFCCGSGYGDDEYVSGDGDIYGYGGGYGYGTGYGDEKGNGYGIGCGEGIKSINGMEVHVIDCIETVITSVFGNTARGFILRDDLTLEPCFVGKGESGGKTMFAHGATLREAADALREKLFDGMSEEERIDAFIEAFPSLDTVVPHKDLFEWHHRLTGSCDMGRREFARSHDLSVDDGKMSVRDFIALTKDAYGGETVRRLEGRYAE